MTTFRSPFDTVSPLDFRYYGADEAFYKRLHQYVSEEAYIGYMARVEGALAHALARNGVCTEAEAASIADACAKVTAEEVSVEEEETQHNVRALVNCIRQHLGDNDEAKRVVHLFATSADIMDTANSLRLKELTLEIIIPDLKELLKILIEKTQKHAGTKQIGRTHGKHAEPITFGFALALFVERLGTRTELIHQTAKSLRGKLSGAVGAYNALSLWGDPDPALFEMDLMKELGLDCPQSHISSQILIPEPVQDLAHAIVSAFTVLANLADDIRHLHRSEILEVQEKYEGARVGSSTMPHKTNPKNFENVKSLWKAFMPRMFTIYLDGISEHQRDLTNSASGRFIIELFTAFAYSIHRMREALGKITVNEKHMAANLHSASSYSLAEPLYILLATYGKDPDAYDRIRELVRQSERNNRTLEEEVKEDSELQKFLKTLPDDKRGVIMEPSNYIGAAAERALAICDYWEPIVLYGWK